MLPQDITESLWKHLGGVAEYLHATRNSWHYKRTINGIPRDYYYCDKCRKWVVIYDWIPGGFGATEHRKNDNPCPIPDQYPGSHADIAEKIRLYLKRDDVIFDTRYYSALSKEFQSWKGGHGLKSLPFWEWLLYEATPLDKITAFHETVKEIE